MPPIEMDDSLQGQRAVLWRFVRRDGYGNPTVAQPVEIAVRWDGKNQVVGDKKSAEEEIPTHLAVTVDIPVGSIMWLGTLADWNAGTMGLGTGDDDDELCEVSVFDATPDVKNVETRREVDLIRYRQGLPVVLP